LNINEYFLLILKRETDFHEESQTPSSRNEVLDGHYESGASPLKREKEDKIRNILVDIKILRLQNLLLEQQLEERSQQIAYLKRKLKEMSHAGKKSIEKEQKMKELILNLESQSLTFREECLKNSEELIKRGAEIEVNFKRKHGNNFNRK